MFHRGLTAWLIFALFVANYLKAAGDDSRPSCGSQNQGQMWPDAANHDDKLLSRLVRCGELYICVRGTWRYHWEAPTVRLDQLSRHAKSSAVRPGSCEVQATSESLRPEAAASEKVDSPSE